MGVPLAVKYFRRCTFNETQQELVSEIYFEILIARDLFFTLRYTINTRLFQKLTLEIMQRRRMITISIQGKIFCFLQ